MAVADTDPFRLSSPRIFLVRMIVFLILVGFIGLILYKKIGTAFMANPGLNGLIFGVLFVGIVMGIRQVVRLFREVRWVNALPRGTASQVKAPILLAPMATLVGDKPPGATISTVTLRVILDSIGTRLDEGREVARYLTGLLIFLGLLGTFWGLIETVGSIGGVIKSMQASSDAGFDDLKNGLAAPLAGMSIAFTSSLFGLSGSLILGFLDLQGGQAQNRFYTELEDVLTAHTRDAEASIGKLEPGSDIRAALDKLSLGADQSHQRASSVAMANLADGIQSLVQHMRSEQQQIRDWVESQAEQNNEIKILLRRLASEPERS
ncbi:flagellar motor protein MotA [Beijerinckia sp. L45]|uniref:flagellar motor protein MotA n=1 Tax=Beijerinckia sp. L45 TaxID=1641855 RepID=UPI00131EB71E|nr:flagellar motor protein MotA [Beijerinckia sp. L45]